MGSWGSGGGEITRVLIREKAGVSTQNYPLSFGHVFKRGDVPSGSSVAVYYNGQSLPSQFDVKSTYGDGSVRHGVISLRMPQLHAHSDHSLSLVRSSEQSNGQGLDKTAILATDVGALIDLQGPGLRADLRKAIADSPQLNYWLKGDVCTEILVRQDLSNQLNALWEVRFYPTSGGSDTPYIRISHTIENINISSRGNVHYGVSIKQGNANPAEVYSKPSFQHNHSSRWRKVFWLGEEPPEVEIRFDLPYMISTGMILPYDTSLQINEAIIATSYTNWLSSNRDIMGNGDIFMYMPGGGGRSDIGMLPGWTALYLLSMDNRMREVMLGNGEMSGSIPIHYREDEYGRSFYGRTVSIDDRVSFNLINYNGPAPLGDTDTPWHADQAHQPSLVYIPYMITGDRWFLDELYYWGGYNLAFDLYHRNTRGDIPGADSSYGLIAGQLRGVAWGLRTLSDAAAMALDSDLEKNYFRSKLINNLSWFVWRNSGANGHGLNAVLWRGTPHTSPSWPNSSLISPWQHDFMVLSAAHIARQHADMPNAAVLRDSIGKFTINRFIELPPYAGVAYRMPLSDKSNIHYTDGDWARFAADVAEYNNNADPKIYFDNQRYSYSYAAIALGASAVVSHLHGGRGVYDFIKEHSNYNTWARNDPTWAFVPVR
ncbi:MAG: hypothetical protein FWH12_01040 [Treponema sp.]|nr:hypothetical protein [Treponema sp.]